MSVNLRVFHLAVNLMIGVELRIIVSLPNLRNARNFFLRCLSTLKYKSGFIADPHIQRSMFHVQ